MKFIFSLVLTICSLSGFGQLAEELSFSEKQFDFGTVKEEAGPIVHEFKFINNSDKSIKILNVKASCGCTTPAWSKEPVEPGASGFIQAQYNPRNRPGQFNKSLTITTDYDDQPVRLYIKGNVIPKPKSIEEELPTDMGGLRVKYRSFNMGKVYTTKEPTVKSFEIYNGTDSTITFIEKVESPASIKLSFEPTTLPAKTKGEIKVSFYGNKQNDLGFANQSVSFFTDQPEEMSKKSVSIFATVLEYFPPMTADELAEAPKLSIVESVYDFGKISKDEKVSTTFVLENKGAAPLELRKTDSNCGCTVASLKKDVIKPGKAIDMEVAFDSQGRKGNQQKSVTVYSNDPQNPVQRVTIKAYVQSE